MSAKSVDAELPELVVVVGPTASGKTELAIRLAELAGGEVISADSVQIYRHFDIGSGKPTLEERRGIPHHLIDAVDPDDELDASVFAERAAEHIEQIAERGALPIVCGGTFLWVRALLYGLAPAPPKNDEIRAQHHAFVMQHSRAALHEKLLAVDPESHQRLMPNDFVRVSRALEVYELTGRPLSEYQKQHGFREPRYRARLLGVLHEREVLHARIEARVRQMLNAGWVDEVRGLIERGYGESRPMSSVGYTQVKAAVDAGGPIDHEQLAQAIAQVTRVFSRRQRTWLREQPVDWLSAELLSGSAEALEAVLGQHPSATPQGAQ